MIIAFHGYTFCTQEAFSDLTLSDGNKSYMMS